MEIKEKFFNRRVNRIRRDNKEVDKIFEKNNLQCKLWDLMALDAKLRCTKKNKIEILNVDEIYLKENIGKITNVLYNKFNGLKDTVKIDGKDENDMDKEYRVTFFVDMENKKIRDCRLVFSSGNDIPFRLYNIENLIRGKFISKMIHKNIVMIIINTLTEKGCNEEDINNYIKGYLETVNRIR